MTDMCETQGISSQSYAQVHILDVPYTLDRPFDYYIPEDLQNTLQPGCFVSVPFGGGNRRRVGLVTALSDHVETDPKHIIKPVDSMIFHDLTLNTEFLRLCIFLKEQIFCTIGEATRAILPPTILEHCDETITLTSRGEAFLEAGTLLGLDQWIKDDLWDDGENTVQPPSVSTLSEAQKEALSFLPEAHFRPSAIRLLSLLEKGECHSLSSLKRKTTPEMLRLLPHLEKCGLLTLGLHVTLPKQKYTDYISLAVGQETLTSFLQKNRAATLQCSVLRALAESGVLTSEELKESCGASTSVLRRLTELSMIRSDRVLRNQDPYEAVCDPEIQSAQDTPLTDEQKQALKTLTELYQTGEPRAALLHGVTGSGKTRVIKAMTDVVLASGRSVLILIPEIALTPQTIRYFRSCYGDRVAMIHSALSRSERFDVWRRIRDGEVSVCIGTRSAIFAPFSNLGMIVIDEEQEHTYKSDRSPRYHARDVARFRTAFHSGLMLLASATPSLESYYKAVCGKYTLIELKQRYGGSLLPQVQLIDRKPDFRSGDLSPIGPILHEKLKEVLSRGEQAILFLNRRGYHHFLTCIDCGSAVCCPDCSVSMAYHLRKSGAYLFCHWCGKRMDVPTVCPTCGSDHLSRVGFGIQKAEEILQTALPDAKILRMDADTTAGKFAFDEILRQFREEKADILLGTQMVVKGHDFPNVTLAAVLSADMELYLDDYRANERTFTMMTQLVGRAGRAGKQGQAIIQTCNPEHQVLRLAEAQNYPAFYQNEIALRRALVFPPFCDMVLLTFASEDEPLVRDTAQRCYRHLMILRQKEYADVALQCFGPFEAAVWRVCGKYRMRMVCKCRMNKRTRAFWNALLVSLPTKLYEAVSISLDVNPSSL